MWSKLELLQIFIIGSFFTMILALFTILFEFLSLEKFSALSIGIAALIYPALLLFSFGLKTMNYYKQRSAKQTKNSGLIEV